MAELIRKEEEELGCENESLNIDEVDSIVIIDGAERNEDNEPEPMEKHKYTTTDTFEYVQLETFDRFYDDYMEFKRYIDNLVKNIYSKTMKYDNKELDRNECKEGEINSLKEKIRKLDEENKQLKEEKQCLYKIIESKYVNNENSIDNQSIRSIDELWKVATVKGKKRYVIENKYEPIEIRNRFQQISIPEQDNEEDDNDHNIEGITDDNNKIHFNVNTTKNRNDKRRPSPVINLFPEKDVGIKRTRNVGAGKQNVPEVVPGNRTFSSITKNGKKICVIGDSHLNRIRTYQFNKSITKGKAYLSVFRGATIRRLKYHVIPTLVEDKPDVIIIHVGCNDIYDIKNIKDLNTSKVVDEIIDIGKLCTNYGVKEIIFSSILPKRDITLTEKIREVNNIMRTKCQLNNFGFICNDNVSEEYLSRDGLHFTGKGTHILASNFVDYLNYFILDRNHNVINERIWLGVESSEQYGNHDSNKFITESIGVFLQATEKEAEAKMSDSFIFNLNSDDNFHKPNTDIFLIYQS